MKFHLALGLLFLSAITFSCKNKTEEEVKLPVKDFSNSVIYEVNIRQYTPEGTFTAFSNHLLRLRNSGVDILWFMPVQPISEKNRKGSLGSYYSIKDYTAINPEFGTPESFKDLVEMAHSMGFKVILDWVANHTGWDNDWIKYNPEWYTQEDGVIVSQVEDWSDVADLNYNNYDIRREMIKSMKFWIEEYNIDGFRCDMAAMVPVDFWESAREALDSVKPVMMLAEAWEPELMNKAFDAAYGWEFLHLTEDIAQGKKSVDTLYSYFPRYDSIYDNKAILMYFLTNHDENSWNGTINERYGDLKNSFAVLTYTLPGLPLIYSGQEAANNKALKFFEKDTIDWSSNCNTSDFYKSLNDLKLSNPALTSGINGGNFKIISEIEDSPVFAYKRHKEDNEVLVILNLSNENIKYRVMAKNLLREDEILKEIFHL